MNEKKFSCPISTKNCDTENIASKEGEKYLFEKKDSDTNLITLFYKCTHLFLHRNGQEKGKRRILSILFKHGNMTQRELLNHTEMRSASLSDIISKIEANGDIIRQRSQTDARNINIVLTEKGHSEAEQAQKEQIQFATELFSALDKAEKEQLEKLLVKLLLAWKSDKKEMLK